LLTGAAVPAGDYTTFMVDMQRGSAVRAIRHDSCIGDRRMNLESGAGRPDPWRARP
jgi:hypothetical protein